ncbi:hypothetical protein [Streptomyces sp. BH105]|uniref:hypothetical protein n=1 Tax=Streptomyces sp. BH105 TaxID=3410408 RepID=UPI003CF44B61
MRITTLPTKLRWLLGRKRGPHGETWTYRALSEAISRSGGTQVSHATIGKIADGGNDNPKINTLEALAAVLGVPTAVFLRAFEIQDLPALELFDQPRVRSIVTLLHGLAPEDLAEVEQAVRELRERKGLPACVDGEDLLPADPPELPPRPGRRRSRRDAGHRAADTLE